MRIAVLVKYCVDPANLHVSSDGRIDMGGSLKKISESDLKAVEEAARVKETHGGSIHLYSLGPFEASKLLREALAFGADKAYLIANLGIRNPDSFATAYILSKAVRKQEPYDLILAGDASEDSYSGAVAITLAELLGLPHVAYVVKLKLADKTARADRNLEEKTQSIEFSLPALVTVTPEINQPRFVSLLQVMRVPRDALVTLRLEDLGISLEEYDQSLLCEQVELSPILTARKNIIFEGDPSETARKLVETLRTTGVI
jgi:electron transfer flavoprotein beta subunit